MFSKTTRYAIKSLAYMVNKGKTSSLNEISEQAGIPVSYLKKVLVKLQKAGILKSVKGKMGGYYLASDPSKINVKDIVRIFESSGLDECKQLYCKGCIAREGMIKLEKQITEALGSITLREFRKEE